MTPDTPILTPEQRQARYDAHLVSITEAIAALPEPAQELVRSWRRAVELLGRGGPTGESHHHVREFVADVTRLVRVLTVVPEAVPERTAGAVSTGLGV